MALLWLAGPARKKIVVFAKVLLRLSHNFGIKEFAGADRLYGWQHKRKEILLHCGRIVGHKESFMTKTSATLARPISSGRSSRRAAPIVAAAAAMMLAACSTLPDWTKPSTVSDAITGQSPGTPTNQTVAAQQQAAENASSDASFPSAGTVPQVPATGDATDKRDLANSLMADRQHARYSGEALRGGTEPPASPLPSRRAAPLPDLPPVAAEATPASPVAQAGVIPAPEIPAYRAPTRRMGDTDRTTREAVAEAAPAATPAETQDVEVSTLPAPAPVVAPAQAPETTAVVAPAVVAAPVAVQTPAAAPQATAAARRPAVPSRAVPTFVAEADAAREISSNAPAAVAARVPVTPPQTTDALGFATSTAPPLPAEVRAQVPAVVSARFEETSGVAAPVSTVSAPAPSSGDGVVIDYGAIGAGSPVPDPSTYEQGSALTLPVGQFEALEFSGAEGGPFTPVAVYFAHGSAALTAEDREQISEVAALHKKRGTGTVRVVGHASSRTSNLPVDSHLLVNFDMSMDRANVVASELMRRGVDASDLVIEAVGDRTPVYYESMPAGEAGNRRTEIFLE